MLEILEFAFESIWHFAGMTLWLCIAVFLVSEFNPFAGIVRIAKTRTGTPILSTKRYKKEDTDADTA